MIGSPRDEIERLKARIVELEERVAPSAYPVGRKDERAAVVAWLYEHAEGYVDASSRCNARWEAQMIHAGEHLKDKGSLE